MKKVLSFIMMALAAVTLFISCEESASVADMRITLDSNTSRLIAPEGVPLEVTNYQISGSGPNSESFSFTTTKTSSTLSGVSVGEWTVKATGYNAEGVEIVTGSTTFTLSASNPGVVVHLNQLVGTGNLSLSMSWNKDVVANPSIQLELTKQNGSGSESLTATINKTEGTATLSKTGLAAGSYILQGRIYSSGILMSGFTEAVRIVGNKTSSAEIEFNLDNFPFAPGSIQLLDQSGVPVVCTVEGIAEEDVNAGEDIEVSLVPERANVNDLTVNWYVDGVLVDTGTTATVNFEPGAHRLDAVAYTSKIGSYGSCTMSINALVATPKGIPGNSIRLDSTKTGVNLGSNTVMKFMPDGKLIVMSGLENTIQVASMVKNGVNIEKEYTNATLTAMNNEPVDFDYHLLDASGTYAIVAGFNSNAGTARFNYSSQDMSITQIETDGALCTYVNTVKYAKIGGMADFDPITNMFVMLAYGEDGTTSYVTERLVKSTTADSEYAYRSPNYTSELSKKQLGTFKSLNAFGVSPNGDYYMIGNANGEIARLGNKQYTSTNIKLDLRLPTLQKSYTGLRKLEISSSDITYFMGNNFIAAYSDATETELSYTTVSGANFTDFAINEETGHVYVVSADEMKLYCYPIKSNGALDDANVVEVETLNANQNIELSIDGSYLILYTKSGSTQFEVMRVKTTD